MDIPDEIKEYVKRKINEAFNFGTTKYGDTPTDALQLVPKKYVDAAVAGNGSLVTLTDGATVALDASLGGIFILVATGDDTISVPTNPSNGKRLIIRHTASGANRTLTLATSAGGFRYGSIITGLTATVSGKTDYIGCIWNEVDTFFDVVAVDKGH